MNFNKLFKIVTIALFGVAIIASLVYFGAASQKDCFACKLPLCEEINEATGEKYLANADDCALTYAEIQQRGGEYAECSKECINYAGNFMLFTIILTIIAAVLAVLFAIYMLIVDTKKIKGVLIGLGGMGLIVLISYLFSSDKTFTIIGYNDIISLAEIKMVDTMLYTTYILLVLAIGGILFTSVQKMIKNNIN